MNQTDTTELWYETNLDVFLNQWYANYDEARQSLQHHGGFLLPYRKHFFICEPEVISALGLDPSDSDWEKTGHDCAQPRDGAACARLQEKRQKILRR